MRIMLERKAGTPVYQQIIEQIRRQILSGELAVGYRLPPERQLAEKLNVNRTTVLNAYRELKAEGLIGSHVGRGTVVLSGREEEQPEVAETREPIWEHLFSEYSNRFNEFLISDILQLVNRKDVVSFAAGIASLECRPEEALRGIQEEFLDGDDRKALLASPVEGFGSLRRAVADYMAARGCYCRPEEIMMLSGSQQGIDLAARMLINPGDIVVMEEPTFFPAINTFRTQGARIMGIPMTKNGLDLDILEQVLQRYRPKLLYVMPNYQNPTGATLPLEGRIRLLELAYRYRAVILEDDAYGELCYDGEPLPSLKSMDKAGFVIYLNTFSKTVYPGLRLGWTVAHKKLIGRFAASRQLVDLHANCLSQQIIERFLTTGGMERHLWEIIVIYRERRDLMIAALERYAPPSMDWNKPAGGYYLWCGLPEGVSGTALVRRAMERGVAFLPGDSFYLSGREDSHIRLNYTFPGKRDIDRGVRVLCEAVRELAGERSVTGLTPEMELSPLL